MLSAIQAIAKITTSVALVSVRPPASNANGRAMSASAVTTIGERNMLIVPPRLRLAPLCCPPRGSNSRLGAARRRSFEPQNPFAQQAARANQQDEHHQQIHRCLGGRWIEVDRQPAHDADDQCGTDDAPERTQ